MAREKVGRCRTGLGGNADAETTKRVHEQELHREAADLSLSLRQDVLSRSSSPDVNSFAFAAIDLASREKEAKRERTRELCVSCRVS